MNFDKVVLKVFNPAAVAVLLERTEAIMATQMEHAAQLSAIAANIEKIGTETRSLIARITELTAAVEAAGNTSPEVNAAMEALAAQVAVVDGLVPDAA